MLEVHEYNIARVKDGYSSISINNLVPRCLSANITSDKITAALRSGPRDYLFTPYPQRSQATSKLLAWIFDNQLADNKSWVGKLPMKDEDCSAVLIVAPGPGIGRQARNVYSYRIDRMRGGEHIARFGPMSIFCKEKIANRIPNSLI